MSQTYEPGNETDSNFEIVASPEVPREEGGELDPRLRAALAGDPYKNIPVWNTVEKRVLAGASAPMRKNLLIYLQRHPIWEPFVGQKREESQETQYEKAGTPEEVLDALKDGDSVTIWDPRTRQKLSGRSAPLKRHIARYLQKNPHLQVYVNQKHTELSEEEVDEKTMKVRNDNKRVDIWDSASKRRITGNARPMRKNLKKFLGSHPGHEEYNGQDREGVKSQWEAEDSLNKENLHKNQKIQEGGRPQVAQNLSSSPAESQPLDAQLEGCNTEDHHWSGKDSKDMDNESDIWADVENESTPPPPQLASIDELLKEFNGGDFEELVGISSPKSALPEGSSANAPGYATGHQAVEPVLTEEGWISPVTISREMSPPHKLLTSQGKRTEKRAREFVELFAGEAPHKKQKISKQGQTQDSPIPEQSLALKPPDALREVYNDRHCVPSGENAVVSNKGPDLSMHGISESIPPLPQLSNAMELRQSDTEAAENINREFPQEGEFRGASVGSVRASVEGVLTVEHPVTGETETSPLSLFLGIYAPEDEGSSGQAEEQEKGRREVQESQDMDNMNKEKGHLENWIPQEYPIPEPPLDLWNPLDAILGVHSDSNRASNEGDESETRKRLHISAHEMTASTPLLPQMAGINKFPELDRDASENMDVEFSEKGTVADASAGHVPVSSQFLIELDRPDTGRKGMNPPAQGLEMSNEHLAAFNFPDREQKVTNAAESTLGGSNLSDTPNNDFIQGKKTSEGEMDSINCIQSAQRNSSEALAATSTAESDENTNLIQRTDRIPAIPEAFVGGPDAREESLDGTLIHEGLQQVPEFHFDILDDLYRV